MLVCESMEACISICMCAKSSIHCSSHPIPSKGVYQSRYLAEAEVLALRLGLGEPSEG
jgi:hypothetical protein